MFHGEHSHSVHKLTNGRAHTGVLGVIVTISHVGHKGVERQVLIQNISSPHKDLHKFWFKLSSG